MNTLQEPTPFNDEKSKIEAKAKRTKVSPCIGCGSDYGIPHDGSTYCPSCIGGMARYEAAKKLIKAFVDDLVTDGVVPRVEANDALDSASLGCRRRN